MAVHKGKFIWQNELETLKRQQLGQRFKSIRVMLNEMYPGDYTRMRIKEADPYILSYQQLKNIEECIKTPRPNMIRDLATYYNVPLGLFTSDEEITVKGFFLGRKEDEIPFFDDFYRKAGNIHPFDPRDQETLRRQYPELMDYEGEPDEESYDVYDEQGSFRLDRVTVEFVMRVYQTSTNTVLQEKRIFEQYILAPEDISFIEETIKFLSAKHKQQLDTNVKLQDMKQDWLMMKLREMTDQKMNRKYDK